MSKYGKKLVVVGCLVERYLEDLKNELPEVDLFVPIREYHMLKDKINGLFENQKIEYDFSYRHRLTITPSFTAYLKISEGCSNNCTYCAIPYIRGKHVSRKMEDILEEANMLAEKGIKELIVIAQDTTKYGIDLYGEYKLPELLEKLAKIITGTLWDNIIPDDKADYIFNDLQIFLKKELVPFTS